MKIHDKIRSEKLQIIFTEEAQKHLHEVKLDETNYCCTKKVKLNFANYFFGNSN